MSVAWRSEDELCNEIYKFDSHLYDNKPLKVSVCEDTDFSFI